MSGFLETQGLKWARVRAVHRQWLTPRERLVWPDLGEQSKECFDLLGERRRVVDYALVEVRALETVGETLAAAHARRVAPRAAVAVRRRSCADAMLPRRLATGQCA